MKFECARVSNDALIIELCLSLRMKSDYARVSSDVLLKWFLSNYGKRFKDVYSFGRLWGLEDFQSTQT